ncbi:hypothetical protein GQ457_08G027840 [Hibiscus cannabinus]
MMNPRKRDYEVAHISDSNDIHKYASDIGQRVLVTQIQSKPKQPHYPKGYDVKTICNYHLGGMGHTIEGCEALKNKIRNLIEEGTLSFEGRNPKMSKNQSNMGTLKHVEGNPYPTFVIKCQGQNSNSSFQVSESSSADNQKSKTRDSFDPIPILYGELYPQLLNARLVVSCHSTPLRPPYPKWYDFKAHYEYHAGIRGHSIENCIAFKRWVHNLLKCSM